MRATRPFSNHGLMKAPVGRRYCSPLLRGVKSHTWSAFVISWRFLQSEARCSEDSGQREFFGLFFKRDEGFDLCLDPDTHTAAAELVPRVGLTRRSFSAALGNVGIGRVRFGWNQTGNVPSSSTDLGLGVWYVCAMLSCFILVNDVGLDCGSR